MLDNKCICNDYHIISQYNHFLDSISRAAGTIVGV